MVDPDLPPIPIDKDHLVFPPIHHENLQIVSPDYHTPPSPSSSSSSSSFFHSSVRRWIHSLRSKLISFRDRRAISSFGLPAAALLLFSFWIIIRIRNNKTKTTLSPNEARLINIINHKDQKIAQLLHQIAQMNEILIHRHKALVAKVAE